MARKSKPATERVEYKQPEFGKADGVSLTDMLTEDYAGPDAIAAMDLTSDEGKMLFVNVGAMATSKPEQLAGQVFQLSAWCAERRLFTDQKSGEERWGVSINLISNEGMIVRFGSDAVCRALDRIRTAFGDGPYADPLPLRIEQVKTSAGRRTYSVTLLPRGNYDPPKPKATRSKKAT